MTDAGSTNLPLGNFVPHRSRELKTKPLSIREREWGEGAPGSEAA